MLEINLGGTYMWWESLTNLQQVSFVIATSATAIMIIFIILMLIGMDSGEAFDGDINMDAGVDVDVHGDVDGIDVYNSDSFFSIGGLRILTIRGALAFFSVGFWMIYALADTVKPWLAVLIGLVVGAVAAYLLALAMKAIMRLESSGNLDYKTAVGKTAVVYIRIPKKMTGHGKVIFNHQGRMVEVDAITKGDSDITSKNEVEIIGLQDETTLVVKKIEEE